MPIDPMTDTLLPIADVANRFPRPGGKKVHKNTVRAWIQRGLRGVKLEGVYVGSNLCTTEDCLRTFLVATNPQNQESSTLVSHKADVEAEERQLALEAELAELGIPSF